MAIRKKIGSAVARVGRTLNLPEWNISERISGPSAAQFTANAPFGLSPTPQQQAQIAANPSLSSRSQMASFPAPAGAAGATASPDPSNPFADALAAYQAQPSGSGAGGADASDYVVFGGVQYDVSDPSQRAAFFAARREALVAERDRVVAEAESQAGTSTREAADEYARQLSSLDQDLADVESGAQSYVEKYKRDVASFTQDKRVGDVNRQGFFSRLSPNAFQSSQASSQGYADQNVGLSYLDSPFSGNLSESSAYGRKRSGLQQDRGLLGSQYEGYLGDVQSGLASSISGANDYVTQNQDQLTGDLAPYDISQGYSPFRYQRSSYAPVQASSVDLSRYTPYTTASSLGGVAPTASGGYRAPVSSSPFSQPAVDSYLQRTPDLMQKERDSLRRYLMGAAA